MARKSKQMPPKKAIYVFWEGESEEAYSRALKRIFTNAASIKTHRKKGFFDTARAYCRGNLEFRNSVAEYDEIWFFFDVEVDSAGTWDKFTQFKGIIEKICGKGKPSPKIRLLMTMGCVEYWFLLHYERVRPSIATPADKAQVLEDLQAFIPDYKKGDQKAVDVIVQNYQTAVQNGLWSLECLKPEIPEVEEERNRWLLKSKHTFTTVHEAIEMLMSLKPLG